MKTRLKLVGAQNMAVKNGLFTYHGKSQTGTSFQIHMSKIFKLQIPTSTVTVVHTSHTTNPSPHMDQK